MNRRSFLKLGAGALVAVVAAPAVERFSAPLYIPAERLEFGVPKAIVTAPDPRVVQWVNGLHEMIAEDLLMWGQFPAPPDTPLVWEEAPRFYEADETTPFAEPLIWHGSETVLPMGTYYIVRPIEISGRPSFTITGREPWPEHIERQLVKKRPPVCAGRQPKFSRALPPGLVLNDTQRDKLAAIGLYDMTPRWDLRDVPIRLPDGRLV